MQRSRLVEGIHVAVLGLWIGTLLMAGLTAAIAFPAMKHLQPSLPGYPAVPEDHWSIAAGHIANPVLTVGVWLQAACAVAALATLLLSPSNSGWTRRGRAACLLVAFALSVSLTGLVAVKMRPAILEYWNFAAAGDVVRANERKSAFDGLHPASSRLMSATLAFAALGLVLALVDSRRAPAAPGPVGS